MTFGAGLVLGLVSGLTVMGFLAIAAYRRGYGDAVGRRTYWRAELLARRAAARATTTARRAG